MMNMTKLIDLSDCVGDSLAKHNYNFLSLDQNICNLSSRFFNVDDNFYTIFKDLCANIDNFNEFADIFEFPIGINESKTATSYLSSYWQKKELNLTFPLNIWDGDDFQIQYLDENTPDSALKSWGQAQLTRKYPPINFPDTSHANVCFLLYSNIGKVYDPVETSTTQLASNITPKITTYVRDGEYMVPLGVTSIDLLLVGGGGGGGGNGQRSGGGGGGGGGILHVQNFAVTEKQKFDITVGKGGDGGGRYAYGKDGGITKFGSLQVAGGKGGHSSVGSDLAGGATGQNSGSGGRGQYTSSSAATDGTDGYLLDTNNTYYGGGGGGGNDYLGITKGGLGGGGRGGHNSYANNISSYLADNGSINTGGGGGGAARDQGVGGTGGSGIVLVIQKQSANLTQTSKIFNVNQRKDDCYIKSIKIGRYKINKLTNEWTFLNFI